MRDDEIRNRLVESNPLWRATNKEQALHWVATDPVLRVRAPFDLGYRPDLLDDVATGPIDDKLIVLRGPRRVGKSVLLKDTVSALCSRADVDVRQIIYLPVDTMRANDLARVVALGRGRVAEFREHNPSSTSSTHLWHRSEDFLEPAYNHSTSRD